MEQLLYELYTVSDKFCGRRYPHVPSVKTYPIYKKFSLMTFFLPITEWPILWYSDGTVMFKKQCLLPYSEFWLALNKNGKWDFEIIYESFLLTGS